MSGPETDHRVPIDWSETTRAAMLREAHLGLLNAGGEDGDWWEIAGEIRAGRPWLEVLAEYFK